MKLFPLPAEYSDPVVLINPEHIIAVVPVRNDSTCTIVMSNGDKFTYPHAPSYLQEQLKGY